VRRCASKDEDFCLVMDFDVDLCFHLSHSDTTVIDNGDFSVDFFGVDLGLDSALQHRDTKGTPKGHKSFVYGLILVLSFDIGLY
jgi:hypothetical protein